jgi:hypothetical protein
MKKPVVNKIINEVGVHVDGVNISAKQKKGGNFDKSKRWILA